MATTTRKTVDSWQIHVNYGSGWEHECTEFSRKDAISQKRIYRENVSYPVKIVKRRIKKSELTEMEWQELNSKNVIL